MLHYEELRNEIVKALKKANITADRFQVAPGSDQIRYEGKFFECRGTMYIYAYSERGAVTVLCQTDDLEELFYYVLKDIVMDCAIDYEKAHRIWYQDSRRVWMSKSLDLMKKIDDNNYLKLQNDFNNILQKAPFDDASTICLEAIPVLWKLLNQIEESIFSCDKKTQYSRELKTIQKNIRVLLQSDKIYSKTAIRKIATQISGWYTKLKDAKLTLSPTIERDLQIALEKTMNLVS